MGLELSKEGYEANSKKIQNLLDVPTPIVGGDVASFVAAANFFRNHLPNFSRVSDSLNKLPTKGKKYKKTKLEDNPQWQNEGKPAFLKLKEVLLNAQTLSPFDSELALHLATDASQTGFGGVLYQKPEPNKINFLRFFGKAFRNAQLNYSMPVKELYAIVYGLTNNHHICYGRQVSILTDSNALTYYHTVQADSRLLTNWYDILAKYHFTISHIPGTTNILPDALSRFNLISRQFF